MAGGEERKDRHPVSHEEARHRFVLAVDGGEAELTYRRAGDRIVFDHTGVPPALQHQGLADRLAEVALAYAREHRLRVEPRCRFMEVYIKRHPEHQDLVAP
jgi:predicted GNAT family acetyltransferase